MNGGFKCVVHVLVALAAALVLTEASVTARKPEPAKVTMKGKQGDVTFDHAKHAKELKLECKTCHHAMDKAPERMDCWSCHRPEKGDAPSAKEAGHGSCLKCHRQAPSKPPVACKDCHKK